MFNCEYYNSFFLDILPTAQRRPRHARIGGLDVTYKDKKQRENERTLEAALAAYKPSEALCGAIQLDIEAILPIPKSWPKKKREHAAAHCVWHTSRPDADNIAKQVKDAMTRLAFWEDDKQVAVLTVKKRYGERVGLHIELLHLLGGC